MLTTDVMHILFPVSKQESYGNDFLLVSTSTGAKLSLKMTPLSWYGSFIRNMESCSSLPVLD